MNLFFNKRMKKGFTLIEIVVVIAILGILSAVAIPSFSGTRENATLKVDDANLRLLNGVTQILAAQDNVSLADVFKAENTNDLRMQKLKNKGLIEKVIVPLQAKKKFLWSKTDQEWTLASPSEKWTPGGGDGDNKIEDLVEDDTIPKTGTWEKNTSGGIKSSYGTNFVKNNHEEYTITSKAKLSEGNNGGYGIFFETSVNTANSNEDTGYILQFDRGRKAILVVKRMPGSPDSTKKTIKNENNSLIPNTTTDAWWTDEHEIKLEVTKDGVNKKLVISIDGDKLVETFSIPKNDDFNADNNYTGFRAWGKTTNFTGLEIEGK